MPILIVSSREFNQDVSRIKKAASLGPVFITDRGNPAHVLLSIAEYKKLTAARSKISELLAMPGAEEIEFDPPKLGDLQQAADFT